MSVILEQLAQILAKDGISSSQEEEILKAAQSLNTPPETNKESTSEQLEEDNEEMQHDLSERNYTDESYIKRWFQATTRLDSFNFSFNFVNLEFQQLDSFILVKFHYSFEKLPLNILLLLLRAWLHWKFAYM
jgi:hypothetical protein